MDPLFPRSREEQKSKVCHLVVVHRIQQAACWVHPGWQSETGAQGQIYIPLSSSIHPDKMMLFASSKKKDCWPLFDLLGNFQPAGQQRRSCCLEREGDGHPHSQSSEEEALLLVVEIPVCANTGLDNLYVGRGIIKPHAEDEPEAERGFLGLFQ